MTDRLRAMVGQVHDVAEQVAITSHELEATSEQVGQDASDLTLAMRQVTEGADAQVGSIRQAHGQVDLRVLGRQGEHDAPQQRRDAGARGTADGDS